MVWKTSLCSLWFLCWSRLGPCCWDPQSSHLGAQSEGQHQLSLLIGNPTFSRVDQDEPAGSQESQALMTADRVPALCTPCAPSSLSPITVVLAAVTFYQSCFCMSVFALCSMYMISCNLSPFTGVGNKY